MSRVLKGPNFDPRGTGYEERPVLRPRVIPNQSVPTGDRRHITGVREGRISFEVFAKREIEKIEVVVDDGVHADVPVEEEFEGGEVETDNASEEPTPAKVGVRRKRRSVGKKTSLQSTEAKKKVKRTRRPQTPKTGEKRSAHKKASVKDRLAKIKGKKK